MDRTKTAASSDLPRYRTTNEFNILAKEIAEELGINLNQLTHGSIIVERLGHMGKSEIYDTFPEKLREAQSTICLPMLATSYDQELIDILKERAKAGVSIKILRASPKLVGQIRGKNTVNQAKAQSNSWRDLWKVDGIEVRETNHREDLHSASSALIDDITLRYVIYDDSISRSTEGTMVEISGDKPANLTKLFANYFENAWNRAHPVRKCERIMWSLTRKWRVLLFLTFSAFLTPALIYSWSSVEVISALTIGFLVNNIDNMMHSTQRIFRKLTA
ncbi:MAG: hypothetical protein Q4F10_06950 [Corynebacterium glutamicum]|nr:hypothetical protein [Corynebacterium glutamicum]